MHLTQNSYTYWQTTALFHNCVMTLSVCLFPSLSLPLSLSLSLSLSQHAPLYDLAHVRTLHILVAGTVLKVLMRLALMPGGGS